MGCATRRTITSCLQSVPKNSAVKTQPQRHPKRERAPAPQPAPPEDPRSEEPEFVDEPDLPPGEPSGEPTRNTKPPLPLERKT